MTDSDKNKVCGIIMPVSRMGELDEQHWSDVKEIFFEAIRKTSYEPKVVWEHDRTDIIQAKIINNILKNDVIICDLSGFNPNVMFEFGLRLATDLPTIIVSDDISIKKLPFDIASMNCIPYERDFINKLSISIE